MDLRLAPFSNTSENRVPGNLDGLKQQFSQPTKKNTSWGIPRFFEQTYYYHYWLSCVYPNFSIMAVLGISLTFGYIYINKYIYIYIYIKCIYIYIYQMYRYIYIYTYPTISPLCLNIFKIKKISYCLPLSPHWCNIYLPILEFWPAPRSLPPRPSRPVAAGPAGSPRPRGSDSARPRPLERDAGCARILGKKI